MEDTRGYNSRRSFCWTLFCIKGFDFSKLFQISRDYEIKMSNIGKSLGKICLKAITDTFFQYGVWDQAVDRVEHEGKRQDSFFWWGWYPVGGGVLPLFANPDPPIKNTLKSVLGLTSVIILKSVRESIFFQSNTFPACKVEDEKEVAKSLIMFNQRKIFYPFQSIK